MTAASRSAVVSRRIDPAGPGCPLTGPTPPGPTPTGPTPTGAGSTGRGSAASASPVRGGVAAVQPKSVGERRSGPAGRPATRTTAPATTGTSASASTAYPPGARPVSGTSTTE